MKWRNFLIDSEKWFIPQMSLDELELDLDDKIKKLIIKEYEWILIWVYQKSILNSIKIAMKYKFKISVLYIKSSLRNTYILDDKIFDSIKKLSVKLVETDSKNIKNEINANNLINLIKK